MIKISGFNLMDIFMCAIMDEDYFKGLIEQFERTRYTLDDAWKDATKEEKYYIPLKKMLKEGMDFHLFKD